MHRYFPGLSPQSYLTRLQIWKRYFQLLAGRRVSDSVFAQQTVSRAQALLNTIRIFILEPTLFQRWGTRPRAGMGLPTRLSESSRRSQKSKLHFCLRERGKAEGTVPARQHSSHRAARFPHRTERRV